MHRIVMGALLVAALISPSAAPAVGQDKAATPEGREWHLTTYVADGRRHEVPGDVDVSLPLDGGQVYGFAGCQGYAGDYEIDGQALTFEGVEFTTEVGCSGQAAEVEAAYLAALPTVVSWAIDDYRDTGPAPIRGHNLVLYDAAGAAILEFAEPDLDQVYVSLRAMRALVTAQQQDIERLTRQVAELRRQVGQ